MAAPTGLMGAPAPEEDGDDTAMFEQMVAGMREHIFGAAEASITQQLQQAQNVTQDVGTLTAALMKGGIDQAKDTGTQIGMDVILGAATEVIDDLFDIARALGVMEEATDDDRKEALSVAIQTYAESAEDSPEEQAAMQALLQELDAEGITEEAAGYMEADAAKVEKQPQGGQRQPMGLMGAGNE